MTRWKDEFAKPKPFSPVHKARWEIEDKTTNEQNMRETGAIIENLVYYVDSAVDEEIKKTLFQSKQQQRTQTKQEQLTYEVFSSLRYSISTQLHHNTPSILATNRDIEKTFGIGPVQRRRGGRNAQLVPVLENEDLT